MWNSFPCARAKPFGGARRVSNAGRIDLLRGLIFVAKVKNGFVPRLRDEIFPTLKTLRAAHCPFANLPEKRASRWGESLTAEKMKQCRWVKPKLVCQVAFVEWTDAGHLRHCTFAAMRDDKKPAEVVRET
jgi:ATP-dependent DNA ligase